MLATNAFKNCVEICFHYIVSLYGHCRNNTIGENIMGLPSYAPGDSKS
jgi:hypothetical protein